MVCLESACVISQGMRTCPSHKTVSLASSHQAFFLSPLNIPEQCYVVSISLLQLSLGPRAPSPFNLSSSSFLEWLFQNVCILMSFTCLKSSNGFRLSLFQTFHLAEHIQVFTYLPSEPGDELSYLLSLPYSPTKPDGTQVPQRIFCYSKILYL